MAVSAATASVIIDLTDARLGDLADELGHLREEARRITKRTDEIAKELRDSGVAVAQGRRFRASIKRRTQESLDTKALRTTLARDLWTPFLRIAEQVRIESTRL
jgi:hypothetical protein